VIVADLAHGIPGRIYNAEFCQIERTRENLVSTAIHAPVTFRVKVMMVDISLSVSHSPTARPLASKRAKRLRRATA
jgi:hypothetical protein